MGSVCDPFIEKEGAFSHFLNCTPTDLTTQTTSTTKAGEGVDLSLHQHHKKPLLINNCQQEYHQHCCKMVKTRGVKRSTTYSEYDLEMAELLEDEDLFLEEQEEAKAATVVVKKSKRSEFVVYKSKLDATFDTLYFVLPLILSFLDSRSLLQAAATNKFLSETVLTPQTILRAVIFGDKQSRDTMESIMALIQRQAIHTPSNSRLLRLMNATRCEGGADCWAFHPATGRAGVLASSSFSMMRSFGLCLCSTCKRFVSNTNVINYNIVLELERSQLATEKCWRVIRAPYTEQATDVSVGPVLLGRNLQQVASNYKESTARVNALEEIYLQRTPSAEEITRREMLLDIYKATKAEFEAPKLAAAKLTAEEANFKMAERAKRKREMGGDHFGSNGIPPERIPT